MKCPKCGGKLQVQHSEKEMRYRKCKECNSHFKSYERYALKDSELDECEENLIRRLAHEQYRKIRDSK